MKQSPILEKYLSLVLAMVSCTAYANPDGETRVPFPKFLASPNATTLYCRAVLGNDISSLNENRQGKNITTSIYGKTGVSESQLKLDFVGKDVLVSIGVPSRQGRIHGPAAS
jgi:hypothetical protein